MASRAPIRRRRSLSSLCSYFLQAGDLLLLPPWVSVHTLPSRNFTTPGSTQTPSGKPAIPLGDATATVRSAIGGAANAAKALAKQEQPQALNRAVASGAHASVLHFALPGVSAATAGTLLPIRMSAGRAMHGQQGSSDDTQDGAGSDTESAGEGECAAEQWWSFGSVVGVYDLSRVRARALHSSNAAVLLCRALAAKDTLRADHITLQILTPGAVKHCHRTLHPVRSLDSVRSVCRRACAACRTWRRARSTRSSLSATLLRTEATTSTPPRPAASTTSCTPGRCAAPPNHVISDASAIDHAANSAPFVEGASQVTSQHHTT